MPFPLLTIAYGYATAPRRMGEVFPLIGYTSIKYVTGLLGTRSMLVEHSIGRNTI